MREAGSRPTPSRQISHPRIRVSEQARAAVRRPSPFRIVTICPMTPPKPSPATEGTDRSAGLVLPVAGALTSSVAFAVVLMFVATRKDEVWGVVAVPAVILCAAVFGLSITGLVLADQRSRLARWIELGAWMIAAYIVFVGAIAAGFIYALDRAGV